MLSSGYVIATEWVFLTVSWMLVAARFGVRLRMKQQLLWISDLFLMFAALCALGLVICDTLTYHAEAMDNFEVTSVSLLQIRFATNYLFDTGMYFPKLSMVAFYYKLVPPSHKPMRYALYALTGLNVFCALTTTFADTFWCGTDPSINWSQETGLCSAFTSMDLMRMNWSLNFICEVLILAYPFPIISTLKLPSNKEKIGLSLIFTLGVATIIVSTGRFISMLYVSNDISIYIWATAEICISIMAVALTALRPLLRKIAQVLSSSVSRSTTGGGRLPITGENVPRSNGQWGGTWRDAKPRRTHDDDLDSDGSEIRLNEVNNKKIFKTQEFTITHSQASGGKVGGASAAMGSEHV